jgi:enoyl-CoA hydratase/carnithine racemase
MTADEALRIGLVSRVVEPDGLLPAVLDYARDIAANCAPGAMETIKQQVRADLDSTYTLTVEASHGAEFREAIDAFTNKRRPQFG